MWGGIDRWKDVSKYAMEVAFGRASMHALMTDKAAPLCLYHIIQHQRALTHYVDEHYSQRCEIGKPLDVVVALCRNDHRLEVIAAVDYSMADVHNL